MQHLAAMEDPEDKRMRFPDEVSRKLVTAVKDQLDGLQKAAKKDAAVIARRSRAYPRGASVARMR